MRLTTLKISAFLALRRTSRAPDLDHRECVVQIIAINSFVFLQKSHPGIYDGNLLPNYNPRTNTDMVDASAFATGKWVEPAFAHTDDPDTAIGYYKRPGNANTDYLGTKKDWFSDHVRGSDTAFDMFLTPTIAQLASEIKHQEDVEFFVKDTASGGKNFYPALTSTAVMCDASDKCSIRYQDPNAPKTNQPFTMLTVNRGRLQLTGVPGSGFKGSVFIDAAFSESAVPEPSSILLVALGSLGALIRLKYGRHPRSRSRT